jgi:hypothetical protein
MATQAFFPFLPVYMSWEEWNGNLLMFYSEEPIPFLSENNWKLVASDIALLPTFDVYPVPNPERFEKWQDWAAEFTLIVNGPSS